MLNISFLACTKVELWGLAVYIAINGKTFRSCVVTLTLVRHCSISNLSELFFYTIMYLNFMFLDQFLFELSCEYTYRNTETRKHTHRLTCKNATIMRCKHLIVTYSSEPHIKARLLIIFDKCFLHTFLAVIILSVGPLWLPSGQYICTFRHKL